MNSLVNNHKSNIRFDPIVLTTTLMLWAKINNNIFFATWNVTILIIINSMTPRSFEQVLQWPGWCRFAAVQLIYYVSLSVRLSVRVRYRRQHLQMSRVTPAISQPATHLSSTWATEGAAAIISSFSTLSLTRPKLHRAVPGKVWPWDVKRLQQEHRKCGPTGMKEKRERVDVKPLCAKCDCSFLLSNYPLH